MVVMVKTIFPDTLYHLKECADHQKVCADHLKVYADNLQVYADHYGLHKISKISKYADQP